MNIDPLANIESIEIKLDANGQPLPGEMDKPEIKVLQQANLYLYRESKKRIENIELYA